MKSKKPECYELVLVLKSAFLFRKVSFTMYQAYLFFLFSLTLFYTFTSIRQHLVNHAY